MPYTPPRSKEVVHMLCRSLRRFFDDESPIQVETDLASGSSGDESSESKTTVCTLRLFVNGATEATARFTVEHVGGNVYDLRGGLVGRPTSCFTCSLPDASDDRPPVAPNLGRRIGSFLLDDVERMVGAQTLRSPDLVAG